MLEEKIAWDVVVGVWIAEVRKSAMIADNKRRKLHRRRSKQKERERETPTFIDRHRTTVTS